ncbi:MerR family transcriptional regulator [Nocardiopsis sp. FIRDI 009]|uniref:MerR family transcriptional regulator n=1 Tax=Nocardiopsis sp. FIRDI 009 TaxID=714197 RepID=UPI000E24540B|nr:MerR family transcriptional regulator [Nocardiopsis sp. FIRDI 009]
MPHRDRLRPIDLAREHGLSTQAVRNYEDDGILPPAPRTPHGFRQYTPLHAQALRTFLALRTGHGHQDAAAIMRAANTADHDTVLRLVDDGHARTQRDRTTLDQVTTALHGLLTDDPTPPPHPLTIGALAHQLRIRPATLRAWERVGIVHPDRDPTTGHRRYDADTVRDAHLAHQLRRAGHPLPQIAEVIAHIRHAGGTAPLQQALDGWRTALNHRARAMLAAAGHLARYLDLTGPTPEP